MEDLTKVSDKKNRAKWIEQRATKGVCDADVWNLDTYFLNVIINGLTAYQQEKNGCPTYMTQEQWDGFLENLVARFKRALRLKEDFDTLDEAQDAADSAFKYLSAHLFELWN